MDRLIKNSTRHNRLADSSPVPDVEGCDKICLSLNTTGNASEMGSFRPVLLAYGMAMGAFPAGVAWIYNDDRNAPFPCLVFYERPDLVERPRIVDTPVHDSLEENLVVQLLFKGYPGDKVACFVEFDESIDDRLFLIIIGKQLYLEGLDHNMAIKNQCIKGCRNLLHPEGLEIPCD